MLINHIGDIRAKCRFIDMATDDQQEKPVKEGAEIHKKEKKKPEGLVIPPKKPKLTKAERRALQEQQRAAKASAAEGGKPQQQKQEGKQQEGQQQQQTGQEQGGQKQPGTPTGAATGFDANKTTSIDEANAAQSKANRNTISLFSHLPPYQGMFLSSFILHYHCFLTTCMVSSHTTYIFRSLDPKNVVETGPRLWPKKPTVSSGSGVGSYPLHPAVIELGYHYACGQIRGGNARCRAMLRVFHKVIGDFYPPKNGSLTDMRHQLDQWVLKPSFQYWTESCRPHSVTMGNAFTFLKTAVASLERDMNRDAMVEIVQDTIQAYIQERIDYAQKAIAQQPALQLPAKAHNGQRHVFLTYGHAETIEAIFLRMAEVSDPSQFRVIIVDSRPLLEGKDLLRTLRAANIDCSYILLNALSYIMRDVTKVYLGASALMSDGGVLGRVGTACVALSAHMHHIPVLVCCESYKISNRVQLESFTGNELGDPMQVAMLGSNKYAGDDEENDSVLKDWLYMDNLRLLNLLYDLTPSDFVSGIVTELGIIPPTSVAVLLREMNPQN